MDQRSNPMNGGDLACDGNDGDLANRAFFPSLGKGPTQHPSGSDRSRDDIEPRLAKSIQAVRRRSDAVPEVGVILGTGLGEFARAVEDAAIIPYAEIPHLPVPGAAGHAGRLILGRFAGQRVAVMQGRCHLYEGHSLEAVCYPVRLLAGLGVRTLIPTCAAGGLAADLQVGDMLIVDDHVNLQFCAVGVPGSRGVRGRDRELGRLLEHAAREAGISARRGVYVAVMGPNYETRAELRFLRRIADAVGMSTIPELMTAAALGMRAVGIAAITNVCNPDRELVADSDHVISAATAAAPRLESLLRHLVQSPRFSSVAWNPKAEP